MFWPWKKKVSKFYILDNSIIRLDDVKQVYYHQNSQGKWNICVNFTISDTLSFQFTYDECVKEFMKLAKALELYER